jgi:hypothetical protein
MIKMVKMINQFIDHLAWVVAKARMRAHSTETASQGMDVQARCASPDLPSVGVLMYRLSLRCGVLFFQVVKTAQSRGRTERTLLSAGALAGREECCGQA